MVAVRVLVTVPDTSDVLNAARMLAGGVASSQRTQSFADRLDLDLLPPSLVIDRSYAPTPLKLTTATQLLASAPQADLSGPGSFVIRGFMDSDDLHAAHDLIDSSGYPRVFSDPAIGLVPAAFGEPPIGTVLDVSRQLGMGRLGRLGMDGTGVAIALIDNGINLSFLRSRGLQPSLDYHSSWSPNQTVTPGSAPIDHGSMCAYDALIAAPRATLLDFAVARTTRQGGSAMDGFLSDALIAFGRLLTLMTLPDDERPFRSLVVNNSWAVFSPAWDFPVGRPGRYLDNPNHPFHAAVSNLTAAGADVLFAAGNCGDAAPDGRCGFGVGQARIAGANAYAEVITVAGVDVNRTLTGYSSPGPGAIDPQKPDIAAFTHFKGSEAFGSGQPDAGTSAACPVMAGVVAALRSRYPFQNGSSARTPSAIKSFVLASAVKPAGVTAFSLEFENGIVDTGMFENPGFS